MSLVLTEARLGGRRLLAQVDRAMVDLELERTMEGAHSVRMTLRDAGMELLRSGILSPGVELVAWRQRWRMVGFEGGEDRSVVVAFESELVNRLKRDRRRYKARTTRPAFTKALARSASPKIAVTIPDEQRRSGPRVGSLGIGIGAGDIVRIRGRAATAEQRVVLNTVLGAAHELGASVAQMRALVAAVIAESNALNVVADASSRGGVLRMPLNLAVSEQARSVTGIAEWFISEAAPGGAPATIAAAVMRRPSRRYAGVVPQASAIVTTFLRGSVDRVAQATALVRKHITERLELGVGAPAGAAGETRWEAVTRVWTELGWYVFEKDARLVVMSGQHARVAKPDLTLRPDDPGVIAPSFATDEGFHTDRLSMTLDEQKAGTIEAGMVVDMTAYGDASGRYVITTERRSAGTDLVSVDLATPIPVVAVQNTAGEARDAAGIDGVPEGVLLAYKRAEAIDKLGYGYMSPSPWDCSYAVSQLLIAGGAISSRLATPALGSLGKQGVGQYMTFFNDPRPGNSGHVYVVFTMPGEKPRRFEFHGPTGARGGWQGQGSVTSWLSRYTPRHIENW